MMTPLVGSCLLLGSLVGLLAGLRQYRLRRSPHPELPRKLLHAGMGLIAVFCPWLYDSPWPVMATAAASALGLAALRLSPPLRRRLGGVTDGVERGCAGEIYFPVGLGLLFWLAQGEALLFCVPALILALADAAAALVGVRWARLRYGSGSGAKSVEGSLAFAGVALVCALAPLRLLTELEPARCWLVALTLSVVLSLVEALARGGSDNILIPLFGFCALRPLLGMSVADLAVCLGAALGVSLCALVACIPRVRRSLMNTFPREA